MKKILFVPREKKWLEADENADGGVADIKTLQKRMGVEAMLTLDFTGKFNIDRGGQLYVFPGHGTAGSDEAHWVKEGENLLTAEKVAQLTAERFPDCTGVSIKIYACHSSEGGFNSFANKFAQAFRPVGDAYDVTISGYRGSVTTGRKPLNEGGITTNNFYIKNHFPSGSAPVPRDSVKAEENHRWSKVSPPTPVYNKKGEELKVKVFVSRASEARDTVAVVNAVKGTVGKRYVIPRIPPADAPAPSRYE